MSDDPMDNDKIDKIFSEIIKSTDMTSVSETIESELSAEKEFKYSMKQLILLQEVLGDSVSNISQIMFMVINNEPPEYEDLQDVLDTLYKIAEDLNNCMVELYVDINQEEFEQYASKGFCIELINNWHDFFSCKMEDFVIIEEDRIVIFTKKLADYFNDSMEDVNEKLVNFLKIYPFIEYDITDNEFLIHCESDKEYFLNAS